MNDVLQVVMERSFWMYNLSRLDPSYITEVQRFIDAAKNHSSRTKKTHIQYPCMDCRNPVVSDDIQQILTHLVRRGFMKNYLIWTKHGEGSSTPYTTGIVDRFEFIHETQQPDTDGLATEHVVPNVPDHGFAGENEDGTETNMATEDAEFLEAMLSRHAEDPSMFLMKGMEALMKAGVEPLYDESKGCTKEFTTLWSVLKLLVCKARCGIADAGFDAFLSIIADMLPKDNQLPGNTYYAKKLISRLTMGIGKIHACRNHYIVY